MEKINNELNSLKKNITEGLDYLEDNDFKKIIQSLSDFLKNIPDFQKENLLDDLLQDIPENNFDNQSINEVFEELNRIINTSNSKNISKLLEILIKRINKQYNYIVSEENEQKIPEKLIKHTTKLKEFLDNTDHFSYKENILTILNTLEESFEENNTFHKETLKAKLIMMIMAEIMFDNYIVVEEIRGKVKETIVEEGNKKSNTKNTTHSDQTEAQNTKEEINMTHNDNILVEQITTEEVKMKEEIKEEEKTKINIEKEITKDKLEELLLIKNLVLETTLEKLPDVLIRHIIELNAPNLKQELDMEDYTNIRSINKTSLVGERRDYVHKYDKDEKECNLYRKETYPGLKDISYEDITFIISEKIIQKELKEEVMTLEVEKEHSNNLKQMLLQRKINKLKNHKNITKKIIKKIEEYKTNDYYKITEIINRKNGKEVYLKTDKNDEFMNILDKLSKGTNPKIDINKLSEKFINRILDAIPQKINNKEEYEQIGNTMFIPVQVIPTNPKEIELDNQKIILNFPINEEEFNYLKQIPSLCLETNWLTIDPRLTNLIDLYAPDAIKHNMIPNIIIDILSSRNER